MKTIRTVISFIASLLLVASCVNVEEQIDLTDFGAPKDLKVSGNTVGTLPSVKLEAEYTLPSGSTVTEQRFQYGFDESLSDAKTLIGEGSDGSFSAEVSIVGHYNENIYFNAYVVNSVGQKLVSKTMNIMVPSMSAYARASTPVAEVTAHSVTASFELTVAPGVNIVESGIVYETEDGEKHVVVAKDGVAVIDGLEQAQTINISSYVKDEFGNIVYSEPVTVITSVVHVESVELDNSALELVEGESASLVATVLPADAYDPSVTWISSDESVVTVEDGKVKAGKAGSAVITVTSVDGAKTATCDVTVIAKVSGVSLSETSLDLLEGETATLKATILPDNATNPAVTWSSDNESVATVKDGVVTAVKAGKATITVTTVDGGMTATCEVTVTAKVTGVTLDTPSLYMQVGETETLKATVKPDNASNKTITWSSSDETVATVEDGKVTAVGAGSAKITVTTEDGGFTATCEVVVAIRVESVALDVKTLTMTEGDKYTLVATITPANATNRRLTWSSDNTTVATVSGGGIVTAVKPGTATIKVRTDDGGKTATCKVTVKEKDVPLRSVTISPTTLTLTVGDSYQMNAKFSPSNATNKKVYWSVDDETVATINDSGKVTAVNPGKTVITVTSDDGNKSDFCQLTVNSKPIPATSIQLFPDVLTIYKSEYAILKPVVTPANSTDTTLVWTSSDPAVVGFTADRIVGKAAGTAEVTVATQSGLSTTIKVIVKGSYPGEKQYVDLGLSVNWATNNVEAKDPRQSGGLYAWGETQSRIYFEWANYKWCGGTSNTIFKYNDNSDYGPYVDNRHTLLPEDDAATVNWGEGWRMATDKEWTELRSKCNWTWVNINGVRGYLVTSRVNGYTDNSIFLPAAGYRSTGGKQGANSYGYYWSSTLRESICNDAWRVYFDSEGKYRTEYFRYVGYSIRPVSPK